LRQCLREVDLVGQLTDTLFIVMLPHTKHRAAEALRQRILAELGLQLPFTLSTTEITESRQLAQLLARANVEREPK
jgi:GGDEF domain-containing protein